MKISGFQKTTLLDFPGAVASTIFFAGCNFRCPFCHNADLALKRDDYEVSEEEVLEYLKKRKGILDGVCITGGEPLLEGEIFDFLKKIKDIGLLVKLDTNGSFPTRLRRAVEEGLVDYVAMDIKNSKDKYTKTSGVFVKTDKIEESIDFLISGKVDYEFRTTVVKEFHSVSDIEEAAKWISGAKKYFLQNFVDSGNLIEEGLSAVSKETLFEMKKAAEKHLCEVGIRGI